MNPNFKEMTTKELRAYVVAHRHDNVAFEEYRSRLKPSSPEYSFPFTPEGLKQGEEVLRQKIQEIENKQRFAD